MNITKSYYKKDFDNNGYTDLLIIGDNKGCYGGGMEPNSSRFCDFSVYTLMNFGNDSIIPIDLMVRAMRHISIVPKIAYIDNHPIIEIHKPGEYHWIEKRKITENSKIQLTYKFNSFIEYNENPKEYHIEKIEFETENSFGECPFFKLTINNNKSATFEAISGNSLCLNTIEYYNDSIPKVKRTFKTNLINENYSQLINILNYMDFPNMENRYAMNSMHTGDCKLKITYDNEKVKTIEDYGMFGTYALNKIYEILFDLRFNQEWQ